MSVAFPSTAMPTPWLTLADAARYLGYAADTKQSRNAFWMLCKRHNIPRFNRGRRVVFFRPDLGAWVRAQQVA